MDEMKAIICVGLGNGDEGKGQVIASLSERYKPHTIVRFNGGAQAAHNVVTSDGRWHTFAQFGSGMFTEGVQTYLTSNILVAPVAMLNEAAHLSELGVTDALERTYIHYLAPVINPYHKAMNQMKERARGKNRHGSCGMGIGETMTDFLEHQPWNLVVGDLRDEKILRLKLKWSKDAKIKEALSLGLTLDDAFTNDDYIERWIIGCLILSENIHTSGYNKEIEIASKEGTILFEGAQGVLLDEWHGFHPYTTWSTTTTFNAEMFLDDLCYKGNVKKLGIVRAYATRHGAGPLPTEDAGLTNLLEEKHNSSEGEWQGKFRFGHFDAVLARYAIKVCGGIDELAITHLDDVSKMNEWICAQGYLGHNPRIFVDKVSPCYTHKIPDMESLTAFVESVEPVYASYDPSSDTAVSVIEEELGVESTFHSWGPSFDATAYCPKEELPETIQLERIQYAW